MPSAAPVLEPPTTLSGRLRHVGPGIIVSGSVVGSGELIVTTKLGAEAGFALLWVILFSCVLKVFLQIELGRHVVSSGNTVLEAFARVPGPRPGIGRVRVHWLHAVWFVMAVCALVQVGGILLGLALVFELPGLGLGAVPGELWPVLFVLLTVGLLASGRYRLVEHTTTGLVCLFTLTTLIAAAVVQTTGEAITGGELAAGLVPSVPPDGLWTAFAVLGITGVGASELVFYPYWCLEKGYARHVGPDDGSEVWLQRARGWLRVLKVDAWVSCALYTTGTVAFYLLGAAVLHRRGMAVDDDALHASLSQVYTAGLGDGVGLPAYAVGAAAVLFSTFFVAVASNARVFTDAVHVFGVRRLDDAGRRRLVRVLCIAFPLFAYAMLVAVGKPVVLVFVGAIAQAAMLPFLALAICVLRYRETRRELAPRSIVDPILWLALLTTAGICVHQLVALFGAGSG